MAEKSKQQILEEIVSEVNSSIPGGGKALSQKLEGETLLNKRNRQSLHNVIQDAKRRTKSSIV